MLTAFKPTHVKLNQYFQGDSHLKEKRKFLEAVSNIKIYLHPQINVLTFLV